MSETLEVTREEVETLASVPAADMTLIARSPDELAAEQRRLIAWCETKSDECTKEQEQLQQSIDLHKSHKWGVGPLQRVLRREQQRDLFYTKVKCALMAGYYIVPNFPCDVFAIRTTQNAGGQAASTYGKRSAINSLPDQKAEVLQIGDGDYQNPNPMGRVYDVATTPQPRQNDPGHKETRWSAEVTGYAKMEFPFAFAKPQVLNATQQAMAARIFDEIAVLPQRKTKADPMIIGRIIRPWERKNWETQQRHLSFLIVWWLDTNTI